MLLKDIINNKFVCLHLGDTIKKAVGNFRKYKTNMQPVVDSESRLLGVFSRTNLYDALIDGALLNGTIDYYYNKEPFSVRADLHFESVVEIVKNSHVGGAPVINSEGKVIGILQKTDMIFALLGRSELLNTQLKAILDSMHNGVIAVNDKGTISLINKGAERIFDIQKEECLGLPFNKVFPDLDLTPSLKHGEVNVGLRFRRGKIVTVANITPFIDDDNIMGAIAIFQDVTELNQVARELETVKALNNTLDTVLNIIYDGIIVVDGKGKITLTNRVFADFMGISPGNIAGQNITKIIPESRLEVVAKTGIPETGDVQEIKGKSLIVSRLPIIKDGRVVGAVGKVIFPQLPEIKELASKLMSLQNKVAYYQEELKKTETVRTVLDSIISRSSVMKEIKGEITQVAKSLSTILITGESGTGKELIARAIHGCSDRSSGPFIKINCAAFQDNLLEAEIFGYAPGAFTGALKNGKPGRFELANGGTIFLDEIGDMSLALQAKILRVLQEREFERVCGTRSIKVDVRILAATNKDLVKAIAEESFREDLFYRLNVINLHIPPLRERLEDIEPLVEWFIKKYGEIFNSSIKGISKETLDVLYAYSWPGNIRELENVVERAVNYARSDFIEVIHLPPYIIGETKFKDKNKNYKEQWETICLRNKLREVEQDLIVSALQKAQGNKTKAAKILNLSRSRLYVKIKEYGLIDYY